MHAAVFIISALPGSITAFITMFHGFIATFFPESLSSCAITKEHTFIP
jgi:hypothetical protein